MAVADPPADVERLAASILLSRRDLAWYMNFVHGWRVRDHQRAMVASAQALIVPPACWGTEHGVCECWGPHECSGCFLCRVHREKRLLTVLPPGWGKTDSAVEFVCWAIGIDPESAAFAFFSYNDNIATERAMAVRDTLWSKEPSEVTERFQMVFPGVRPAPERPWSQERFFLWRKDASRKDPTLVAAGVTGSVNARRLKGLVFDDPHNQENSATPYQRGQVWSGYKRAMETRLVSDGWQWGITTRWADDDWGGRVLELGWPSLHVKALEEGKSTWPYEGPGLGFTTEYLLKLQAEDPVSFYLQYQGEIVSEEGAVLAAPTRTFWQPPQFKRIVQSWDTGVGEDRQHSESCCTVWGEANDGIYWLNTWTGQLPYHQLLNKIVEMETPETDIILIEQASNAEVLIPQLKSNSGFRHKIRAVTVGGRGKTREAKIAAAAPYFQSHVLMPAQAPWREKAIGQIMSYRGDGKFRGRDDIVMSAVQAIGFFFPAISYNIKPLTVSREYSRYY